MAARQTGCGLQPAPRPRRVASSRACACLAAVLGALLAVQPGFAGADTLSHKADAFVLRAAGSKARAGWSSVIVRLDTGRRVELDARWRSLRCDVYRHLPIVQSVAVRVPTRNLESLAALTYVKRISADATVKKLDEFTVGSSGADVAFQQYGVTGQGITVAVLDTGVRSCPDFTDAANGGSRILRSVSMLSGAQTTSDACGHGTHVAGIVSGNGAASSFPGCFRTFYGIARQASLVDVRVLDQYGAGDVSDVVAGIQWVISRKDKYNIRVLNLSLGHPVGESYTTDPLCQAVEAAWKAGIVVVCAAGNEGRVQNAETAGLDNEGFGTAYGSIQSPGNDPYAITVGAMKSADGVRSDDRIATYSSRGPARVDLVLKPDIVAPGNRVISLQAANSYLSDTYASTNGVPVSEYFKVPATNVDLSPISNKYFRLSGTSMAAPVVAGAAALMLQADPTLRPDTVKARLMISADKWAFPDGTTDLCTFGAGYLDIPGALACRATPAGPALSPTLVLNPDGTITIDGATLTGGDLAIWGSIELRAIWGERVLWGKSLPTSGVSSDRVVWGKDLPAAGVWSDRVVWGKTTAGVDLTATALNGE